LSLHQYPKVDVKADPTRK